MLEVYIDEYILSDISKSQDRLHHVANAIMTGINDISPPDKDDKEDAISPKKILKRNLHGQLLKMFWGLNMIETQDSTPYGSLSTPV